VHAAALLRDGRALVTTNQRDLGCPIVDTDYRTIARIPSRAKGVTLSPDEQRIALMYSTEGLEYSELWSIEGGARIWRDTNPATVGRLGEQGDNPVPAFSPGEGSLLVTAQNDSSIRVMDGFDGALVKSLVGHTQNVRHLIFSSNGEQLLSCGLDGVARLWDMRRFEEAQALEPAASWLWHGAISPDGQRVAAGGESGEVYLWNSRSGERQVMEAAHSRTVRWVGFHPDGRWLLTCGDDGIARLWDVEDGSLRSELPGHHAAIYEAGFADGGTRVLTLGRDATTRVWEIPSGRLLGTHVEYSGQEWLTFTPEGYYVASGQAAEWARVRRGLEMYPLSSFAETLDRPDLVEASLAGVDLPPPTLLPAPELTLWGDTSGIVDSRLVQVEGDARSRHGITEVRVTVGGRLATGESVPPSPMDTAAIAASLRRERGGRVAIDLPVRIPDGWSEILIRVRALSTRGVWSKVATLHRRYVEPERRAKGRLFLVALGVQDYDDDRLDLQYARKDVEDIAQVFRSKGPGLFSEVIVEDLLDGEVNKGELGRVQHEVLYQAGPEDTIVVYVAGHGVRLHGKYYFLTSDQTPSKPYGGLTKADLWELVAWEGLESKRKLLLIDTCHAGESYERGVPLQDAFTKEELKQAAGEGLYIVTASTEEETAKEVDGNGLFTRVLLEALGGEADTDGDGEVDTAELIAYATKNVTGQRVTTPLIQGGVPFPLTRVGER
jgi:hypothetical protein